MSPDRLSGNIDYLISEKEIDTRVNEILKLGAVIATTSDYRKQVFGTYQDNGVKNGVGFSKVEGINTEVFEKEIKEEYEINNPIGNDNDKYRSKMAEAVAKGKLEGLKKIMTPEFLDNKVLIGADTMPVYYWVSNGRIKPDKKVQYRGDAISKNADYDLSPEEVVVAELGYLVDMHREYLLNKKDVSKEDDELFRGSGVQVVTGVAIQLPGSNVESFSASSFLVFERLREIAEINGSKEREIEIQKILSEIINNSNKVGKASMEKVSGGINFADTDIANILKIHEVLLDEQGEPVSGSVEKGIYLGAPENAIKNKIKELARKQLEKEKTK